MIVVDASALTDFLLGRREALEAVGSALARRTHEALHAPELVELETLNALRRLVRGDALSPRRADQAIADLGRLRLVRYPHAPLRQQIWDLRDRLSAYDASYLALAAAAGDSTLLTADTALADVAARLLGKRRVQLVQ